MQQHPAPQLPPAAARGQLADDLFSVLGVVRRGWVLIVVSVAVCLTLGLIYVAKQETTYQGFARLLVLQQGGRVLPGPGGGDSLQGGQGEESLSTHVMIIRSPIIIEQALAASGLKGLSVDSVIRRLTITLPDPSARVLQVGYTAGTRDEAYKVIKAVVTSYDEFLKNNYQKNTGETIRLFTRARDELSSDLTRMEKEYLEYRQKNPSYSTDESGRSFLSRRLDRWEQAASQAVARSLQLQAQLELGHKLLGEGAETSAVAGALSRMGELGEEAKSPPAVPEPGGAPRLSYEQLEAQVDDVAFQRLTAERLLAHTRAARDAAAASSAAADAEVARVFEDEPATVELRSSIARAQTRYAQVKRLARGPDPSVVNALDRVKDLEGALTRLWERRRPEIAAGLSRSDADEAVRQAEAGLRALAAREAALRESLAEVKADRLRKAHRERDQLAAGAGPADARVRQLDQLIRRLEESPAEGGAARGEAKAQNLLGSIEQGLKAVEAMRARIQEQFEKDLAEAKKAEIGMLSESNLRNNLERQRALFHSVVDQLKKAQLVSDFSSISAQMLNPPSVSEVRPRRALTLVAVLLAGVALGAGLAFVADQLDSRIRSLAEMRRALNLCVLGVVPSLGREQRKTSGMIGLICHALPRSFVSEAYKSVRTNFEYLRRGLNAQVVLVSSPQSGDGKSTTASNLAISLAHAGRRVLLVDADLRRPTLHQIHGVGRGRGLPHVLKDVLPLHRAVQASQVENLDLLPAGPEVDNPAELLASHHLARAVGEMRRAYDVVIFDSPPLLAVADPSIIAASVDGIILVVRTTSTCRPDVERTVELLKTLGAPVLGAVINGTTPDQMGSGYGYGYGYGRGYGTYGSPEAAAKADLTGDGAKPGLANGSVAR